MDADPSCPPSGAFDDLAPQEFTTSIWSSVITVGLDLVCARVTPSSRTATDARGVE